MVGTALWQDVLWAAIAWLLIGVLGIVGGAFFRHYIRQQPWRLDVTIRERKPDDEPES